MTRTYFAKKKKTNATLGDNRSRNKKKIFLKLSACNYWRIANYDQIVIDTRNSKTGIFKNTLGLFCVLQYCLPFKLRLPKKNLLARGSWVLFYMFIFHHWFWLKWRLFFRQNVFCRQILTDSLYFVGFIIFLYAQPSNYVLSLCARCIDNKRKFSQQ